MNKGFQEDGGDSERSVTVRRLRMADFRNYAELDLLLAPGLSVLYGRNAQGKTNALEALYVLSTTRLLRGSRDSEAVRQGAKIARVAVDLEPFDTEIALTLEAGRRKIAQLNRISLPRAADLLGRLPCVCISALDMMVVRGSPEDRRLFLDLELSQLSPAYLNHLTHYKRALEHRNALLRRAQESRVGNEEFSIWESVLAEHGSEIRQHRMDLVAELAPLAAGFQNALAAAETLTAVYEAKDPADGSEALLDRLEEYRSRDIARGTTSAGPHRDDLAIVVDGRDARYFGSQGQQRTAVLALKLATHRRQREVRGAAPLLLLDDILSDLDEGRRARLVEWILSEARQAVLTCTEPDSAGPDLVARAQLFEVQAGTVSPR